MKVDAVANLDFSRIHPLTGPVFVKDARPGDTLEVEILDLRHKGWGWNGHLPRFNAGNIDIRGLTIGATAYLPVWVEGAWRGSLPEFAKRRPLHDRLASGESRIGTQPGLLPV